MVSTVSENSAVNGVSKKPNWIPLNTAPLYQSRKIKIITAGAGFSGLIFAHKIQNELHMEDIIDHVIYEKNPSIGGAWYENTYPGLKCDVPAAVYTFPWEPNPDWSSFCAPGPEILAYIKRTADKWNLNKNVHLSTRVLDASWQENEAKWKIKLEKEDTIFEDYCDIFINASGVLNKWKYPDIPGLKDYEGHLCHSACWDHSYDFTDKKVAIIGNGSSGIQILPQIQPVVKHLTNFSRSASWIGINIAATAAGIDSSDFKYSEAQKEEWKNNPKLYSEYRYKMEGDFLNFWKILQSKSPENAALQVLGTKIMQEQLLNNPDLIEKMIPKWQIGCRRLSPGDGYLRAVMEKNVTNVFKPIKRFTPTGLVDNDDDHHEVEAVICATGFSGTHHTPWKQTGRGGIVLNEKWATDPPCYFGVSVDGFPNYFMFGGPYGPNGHGPYLNPMAWIADYILLWVQKMAVEDIRTMEPKLEAIDDFITYAQESLKLTVYAKECSSWYKNYKISGNILLWPGSMLHMKEMLNHVRPEDYNIEYRSRNRYKFFGDGFTQKEHAGEITAHYLKV